MLIDWVGEEGIMQTSLDLTGANCPYCFQDTLAGLTRIEGVSNVHGSMGGSCIVIDHDDEVTVDALVELIHGHLHGVQKFSNEIEMVSVDLSPLARSCVHSHATPQASSGSSALVWLVDRFGGRGWGRPDDDVG
jgi:copper chaperone CopZ